MAEPIRIRFHRSIYDPTAVRKAADRFVHIADVTVEDHEHDTVVTLVPARESLRARLADEVSNHALFESIVAARSA